MRSRWVAAGLTLLAGSLAQAQTPDPRPLTPDPRAADAVQFFGAFCVSTAGTPDRALAVLADGNALAVRLPADVVRQAQGDREGGIGWTVRSPNDAEFMLDYDARGVCALRLREADERSVRNAFEAVIAGAASGAGAELSSGPVQVEQVNGGRTTYRAYSFPLGGRTAHLALTTADRTIGAQQHFMTFAFVK